MINASVYQGESRAFPRWVVTGIMIVNIVWITGMLLVEKPGAVHGIRDPLAILQVPYQFRPLAFVLGLFCLYGAIQFGRRRSQVKWGVSVLLVFAYLKLSQFELTGYEIRDVFISGAVLGGWVFGVFFSQTLDARLGRSSDPDRDDALGEAAAAGVFAAVYVGAFVSKMLDTGLSWAEGSNLLATVVSRHPFQHSGGLLDYYLNAIILHPVWANAFAVATVCIQGGMVLYLVSPRWRMVMGALVIGFHLNALLLMNVHYFGPMLLSLAFSFPWPLIIRRLRGGRTVATSSKDAVPTLEDDPALRWVVKRSVRWVIAIGWVVLLQWAIIHWNDDHHLFSERGTLAPASYANERRSGQ